MYGGLLLDTILYAVLMLFFRTVALVLMIKDYENGSQRMKTAAMQHTPFFFYCILSLLTIWIKPTYWLIHIKYWYRKVKKIPEGWSLRHL